MLLRNTSQVTVKYDSKAEQSFAEQFQALKTEWQLKREPEPVPAGTQVIIPDFSLEKEGVKVYLEIVGFWTQEYLRRKIEKLRKTEVNMLVAFNEDLACEKITNLQNPNLNIIYYKEKIPLGPVLRYLEQSSQGIRMRQEEFLKSIPVMFTEPTLDYEEFASRMGVSVEAVKKVLAEKTPKGYIAMPNCMVREDRLDQIKRVIEQKLSTEGRLALIEALRLVESEGVIDANKSLETLGYRIVWHGINAEEAEIVKPSIKQP
jgi:hypothetical protein